MELVLPQADKFDRSSKCYAHCPLRRAGNANKGGISLFKKEISLPYTLPEKISIASEQLKELQCLPIALPARGGAAFEAAIRFASASIIRCCAAVGGFAARKRCNRQALQLFELLACNVNFLWEGAREGYLFSKKRYPSLIRVLHTRWEKTGTYCSKRNRAIFSIATEAFLMGNI